MAEIATAQSLNGWPLRWLPEVGHLQYLADPFGLWRDGRLYVFVEHFDYRDAIGRIVVNEFDESLNFVGRSIALTEPWHLSYPFVFEAEGETWLLPESFESGGLWLYRATQFPCRWERVARIELDHVPLDATPFHDGERWWLFYATAFPEEARLTQLCAAHAENLAGPWRPYRNNPFFFDTAGARPGGTPFRFEGVLYLPVQACTGTYGAAVRLLKFDLLHPDQIVATPVCVLNAPSTAAPFVDGCHTLSAAGSFTLIDVKQTRISLASLAARPFRRLYRRTQPPVTLLEMRSGLL